MERGTHVFSVKTSPPMTIGQMGRAFPGATIAQPADNQESNGNFSVVVPSSAPSSEELDRGAGEFEGHRWSSTHESWTVRVELEPSLELLVQPGTAPPEAIAELLSEISSLYRLIGGSGVTFTLSEVRETSEVPV